MICSGELSTEAFSCMLPQMPRIIRLRIIPSALLSLTEQLQNYILSGFSIYGLIHRLYYDK